MRIILMMFLLVAGLLIGTDVKAIDIDDAQALTFLDVGATETGIVFDLGNLPKPPILKAAYPKNVLADKVYLNNSIKTVTLNKRTRNPRDGL